VDRGPWRLQRPGVPAAALYDDARWLVERDGGALARDPTVRLHACRCELWMADAMADPRFVEGAAELAGAQGLSWSCAGHPAVEFPWSVDGVLWTVDPQRAVAVTEDFLRRGWPEAPSHLRARPSAWLLRCERLLAGTALASALRATCARALDADEPRTRARAAHLLSCAANSDEARAATRALAEGHPGWREESDPFLPSCPASEPLQDCVARRLLARVDQPEELTELRRALEGWLTPNELLSRALAERDRLWFASRMTLWLARAPGRRTAWTLVGAVRALNDPALDEALLAVARADPSGEVASAIAQCFFGARRAHLLERIARLP
jgi:hypothetical protein